MRFRLIRDSPSTRDSRYVSSVTGNGTVVDDDGPLEYKDSGAHANQGIVLELIDDHDVIDERPILQSTYEIYDQDVEDSFALDIKPITAEPKMMVDIESDRVDADTIARLETLRKGVTDGWLTLAKRLQKQPNKPVTSEEAQDASFSPNLPTKAIGLGGTITTRFQTATYLDKSNVQQMHIDGVSYFYTVWAWCAATRFSTESKDEKQPVKDVTKLDTPIKYDDSYITWPDAVEMISDQLNLNLDTLSLVKVRIPRRSKSKRQSTKRQPPPSPSSATSSSLVAPPPTPPPTPPPANRRRSRRVQGLSPTPAIGSLSPDPNPNPPQLGTGKRKKSVFLEDTSHKRVRGLNFLSM